MLNRTTTSSEVQLIWDIADGKHEAVGRLHHRYSKPLYSIALLIINDPRDAEEVLQDVFIGIWQKADSFDIAAGHPFSWAVGITRNKAIDRLRSKQRRARLFAEDPWAGWKEPAVETQTLISADHTALLRIAINNLPSKQGQAIEMAFFEGRSHMEIAQMLQEPLGTIKARIRRGLLLLRDCLGGQN